MTRFARNLFFAAVGGMAFSLSVRPLHAQSLYLSQTDQASQVQRMGQLMQGMPVQEAAPDLYAGEDADTGDQEILKAAPVQRWNWVQADINTQYFYTSNAGLTNTGIKGTGLMVNTLSAQIAAPPVSVPYGNLFPRIGYLYQLFDYGIFGPGHNLSDLDFDVASLYAEAQYLLPNQWSILGNLTYTRLLNDGSGYNEFYKELVPSLGIQKTLAICDGLQGVVSYVGDYRFSDEPPYPEQNRDANNRTDQALTLLLNWSATPSLTVSPFYRFQYSYFPNYLAGDSRSDFVHTLGLSANYSFNSWSSIQVFVSYEMRDSSMPALADYRKLDAGGGVSLSWKF